MPPDADSPEAWLRFARSDYFVAEHKLRDSLFETHCFHAQQCVEKALKALMVHQVILPVPRTHDLAHLLDVLQRSGTNLPLEILNSASLSLYAVESRYPGFDDPVSEDEWKEAVLIAKTVLDWAISLIQTFPES